MLASAYQPYLYLPRPVSRRHPMDVGRRAKQFAPFAALRGLDETIRQQEIIYEPKRDLSEEKKNELDMKLRILAYGMKIQATYFQKVARTLSPSLCQFPCREPGFIRTITIRVFTPPSVDCYIQMCIRDRNLRKPKNCLW